MRFFVHLYDQIDPLVKFLAGLCAAIAILAALLIGGLPTKIALILTGGILVSWLVYKLSKWVYTEWLYYSGQRERYNTHWDW